jgi:hypothetical protein
MEQTRDVFDPFEGRTVKISNNLTDRLRGKYAVGPMLANGEPEFGWRQFETPAIQIEAADVIERLRAALNLALPYLDNGDSPGGCDGSQNECEHCAAIRTVRSALDDEQSKEAAK